MEHNSKMNLREVRWEGVVRMHLVQGRNQWRDVVNTAMNLKVL
jgi:hypothetical protein